MKIKQILFAGCITFTILFFYAILFYKERTVFTDIAYHLFYLTKEGNFAIQNNRFGAAFTQLFPLIAIRMDASLDAVMLVYSIAFVFYYFIIFILIAAVFKNRELALIMLLWPVLFVSHTFYWIQSELPQGIAMMLLFFACYKYVEEKKLKSIGWRIILLLFLILTSGFHPIILIPFGFIGVFYILSPANFNKKQIWFLAGSAAVFLFALIVKSVLFPVSAYEVSALGGLKNFIRFFPDYFTIESNLDFLINCLRLYYFLPVLLSVILVHYYRHHLWWKFYLTLISFFGYLLLINVCYHSNTPAHYIENLYLPLSLIVLFPFIYDVLPVYSIRLRNVSVLFIIFAGLIRIYFIHIPYTNRLVWEENYLQQNRFKKAFVDKRLVPMDTLIDTWATPYEFWLLSTSQYDTTASIYITDNYESYYYHLPENKALFLTYGAFPYNELNSKYFNLVDTSRYTVRKLD